MMPGFQPLDLVGNYFAGRQAVDQERAADTRNALARSEMDYRRQQMAQQQQTFDQQRQTFDQQQQVFGQEQQRQLATQMVQAAQYGIQSPNPKAFIEQNYPQLAQLAGPQWNALDDNGVRQKLQEAIGHFGPVAGIGPAPPPKRYETIEGPRGSRIQRDPVTGEEKQVIGPDNSQPNPNAGNSAGSRTFRNIQGLRKEFDGQQAVKDYKSVVPLYRRAIGAPNTRAGDISIIYALGKMFDPNSVVREGELTLSQNTAPWLQKLVSSANSQLTGKGALNPETRKAITDALRGQLDSLRMSYQNERDRFAGYANDNGWAPGQVVGPDPGADFDSGSAASQQAEITATGPDGQKIVLRNGQWVPL